MCLWVYVSRISSKKIFKDLKKKQNFVSKVKRFANLIILRKILKS